MQLFDRILETSETTGTGDVTLDGAILGYSTFSSVLANGEQVYYTLTSTEENAWECGIGTLVDETTLERTLVLNNNAGTTDHVDLGVGLKNIFCDPTALAVFDQIDHFEAPRPQKMSVPHLEMLWGDGLDGDLNLNDDILVLDSPKYFNNLVLSDGATLSADGYRIHAKTIIVGSGCIIHANGYSGTSDGTPPDTPTLGEFPIASGRGTAGTLSAVPDSPEQVSQGDGGDPAIRVRPPWQFWSVGNVPGGGAGGAGGQGDGAHTGGSGGNGGGRLVLIADTIINNGTISAYGGNGANSLSQGGCGGSGGLIYIICRKFIGNLPICPPGDAGNDATTGENGNFIIYDASAAKYRINE